jgi:hypothetical protein
VRRRLSPREVAELAQELDKELEDPATRNAVQGAWQGRGGCAEPSVIGFHAGPDLSLLAKAAQQDMQITNFQEQIESLESQRRWLLGGLGVSVAAFLILVIKRRPRTSTGLAPARQQPGGMRA